MIEKINFSDARNLVDSNINGFVNSCIQDYALEYGNDIDAFDAKFSNLKKLVKYISEEHSRGHKFDTETEEFDLVYEFIRFIVLNNDNEKELVEGNARALKMARAIVSLKRLNDGETMDVLTTMAIIDNLAKKRIQYDLTD